MKNLKFLIASLVLPLLLTGCPNQPSDGPKKDDGVYVKMDARLNEEKTEYDLRFEYHDSYFDSDAKTYSPDIANISFAGAVAAAEREKVRSFYADCDFNNISDYGYNSAPSAHSIGYTMSHKTYGDYELFALSIRGINYAKEWTDNFDIGETGDHAGFSGRAQDVFNTLTEYVANNKEGRTVKLWVTGYSRGGAVANVLADLVLTADGFSINQSDLYVYTFEAPKALLNTHVTAYECVHNMVNRADLITYVAPSQFGFARCGTDHDIYDADVSTIVNTFDNGIVIPEFTPFTADDNEANEVEINSEVDLINHVLNYIITYASVHEDSLSMATREDFYTNYQAAIEDIVGIVFGMPSSTQKLIMDRFSTLGMLDILILVSSSENIYNFLKPYLEDAQISYVEETLIEHIEVLRSGLFTTFATVVAIAMGDYKENLTRILDMHYPEVTYALLQNYNSKLQA